MFERIKIDITLLKGINKLKNIRKYFLRCLRKEENNIDGYVILHLYIDIDECVTEKPCGQLCRNLPGTYECYCRAGFHLQQDGQSCRRNGEFPETARTL